MLILPTNLINPYLKAHHKFLQVLPHHHLKMCMKTVIRSWTLLFLTGLMVSCQPDEQQPGIERYELTDAAAKEAALKIRNEVSATVDSLLQLTVWASDSLLSNPVALDVDDRGRAYVTRTNRRRTSEFDIRGHRDWETSSISFLTVEDRRSFIREQFPIGNEKSLEKPLDFNGDGVQDWRDLTIESEEVHFIEDRSGDGVADYTQLFATGFNTEITDVAGGVMAYDGDVFLAVAPDLWRLRDLDQDGLAENRTSLMHGFQVHIGFGGHNMSGVIMGPDGRVYWAIGDIGFNGVDQDGRKWVYPNQGVIVRCNPDGSDFEVYAAGLRNTHEFVFDAYGNLISVDNDGDHPGESERLVYLTNGSDSGWRINWQFGKYRDPKNNDYKVWMDEGLNLPRFDAQPAHITPCIRNYENGPTGMVYNPGAALSRSFANHFFVVEFNGNPARSGIHTFTLKQAGASFAFEAGRKILGGLLPTGLDVGPGGALYLTDWIDGWEGTGYGRIWKLDSKDDELAVLRKETKEILKGSFADASDAQLAEWLGHSDMRVRQHAQFALVRRSQVGLNLLIEATQEKANQLRRIHGIWGIAQMAREDAKLAQHLVTLLQDYDAEIRAQAAKMLGDVRYEDVGPQLIPLLKDPSQRVQFFAAEAIGRIGYQPAFEHLVEMLAQNNDQDAYLRHAGTLAISRLGMSKEVKALSGDDRRAVRLAAILAMRRMRDPGIANFLQDQDEFLVTEASRAINDDWSIPEALPALAGILNQRSWTSEALIRRSINANLRVGGAASIAELVRYSENKNAEVPMRSEAIAVLGVWPEPSPLDRVDGRFRGHLSRPSDEVIASAGEALIRLLRDQHSAIRVAALNAITGLSLMPAESKVISMVSQDRDPKVRALALQTLTDLDSDGLRDAMETAMLDEEAEVRVQAIKSLANTSIESSKKVELLSIVLDQGGLPEQQAAIDALSKIDFAAAKEIITNLLEQVSQGQIAADLHLDVLHLAEQNDDPDIEEIIQGYRNQYKDSGKLSQFIECVAGGDPIKGRDILVRNSAAQCLKCHAIAGYGGVAGPALDDVGQRLSAERILESLVDPSAEIAAGFGSVTLIMNDEQVISGILKGENQSELTVANSQGENISVKKDAIKERINAASSMPSMEPILSKYELRDLIAFLETLKGQNLLQ